MSNAPKRTRKALGGYFWLMVCLYALLALGLFLLIAGMTTGTPVPFSGALA